MIVRVARSPLRLLGYALVAVPVVLLAVDMLVAYRFYPHPETTAGQTIAADGSVVETQERVYTQTGQAQRRRDLAWGTLLLAGGAATLVWAFVGLVTPRRLLVADDQGLAVWVGGRGHPPLLLAWPEVAEVRSGLRRDEAGEVPVLSLRLHDPGRLPWRPRGGVAEPPWLHLFAGEWDRPAHQVAALVEGYVTGFRGWEAYG